MRNSRALVVTLLCAGAVMFSGCSSAPSDPKAATAVEWVNELGAGNAPGFCQGPSSFEETPDVKVDTDVEPEVVAQPGNGPDSYLVKLSVKDSKDKSTPISLLVEKDDDGKWCVAGHYGI